MSSIYEIPNGKNIKIYLNGNENGYNPFNEFVESSLNSLESLRVNRYPNNNYKELKSLYAEYVNLSDENIIVGNGSDEMLNLVISNYINYGRILVTLKPDFGMYDFYCSINEGIIKKFKLNPNEGHINIRNFIKFSKEVKADLIIFSNPNNPTGMAFSRDEIIEILNNLKNTIVLVDEAYYEFFGQSVVDLVKNYSNLLITRTLSKAWGMAALRVGFLIGEEKKIKELNKLKVPYNVNSYSNIIASNNLKYKEVMLESVDKIIKEREVLFKQLAEFNNDYITFYKSYGNYIFGSGRVAHKLGELLEKDGILIRVFNNNSIRITIGNREENIALIKSIKKAIKGRVLWEE
ncbi:histidinol-phosphate transaminase [Clostridium sp.]|uniref:histidinol-phosphate transaminase n=1 Tax=Clostridium sp. TaxID=1506 RepID=UPI0039945F77